MRQRRTLSLFLMLSGGLALALVSCGETATAQGLTRQQGYSVRAVLTSPFPQNHIPPFDKTSVRPAAAQALYEALLSLPVEPRGMFCPVDWGTVYHLTFFDATGKVVAAATVESSGCEEATLPDGSQRWAMPDKAFWEDFSTAMNVSQSALHPTPQSRGPSAPTSLPN